MVGDPPRLTSYSVSSIFCTQTSSPFPSPLIHNESTRLKLILTVAKNHNYIWKGREKWWWKVFIFAEATSKCHSPCTVISSMINTSPAPTATDHLQISSLCQYVIFTHVPYWHHAGLVAWQPHTNGNVQLTQQLSSERSASVLDGTATISPFSFTQHSPHWCQISLSEQNLIESVLYNRLSLANESPILPLGLQASTTDTISLQPPPSQLLHLIAQNSTYTQCKRTNQSISVYMVKLLIFCHTCHFCHHEHPQLQQTWNKLQT